MSRSSHAHSMLTDTRMNNNEIFTPTYPIRLYICLWTFWQRNAGHLPYFWLDKPLKYIKHNHKQKYHSIHFDQTNIPHEWEIKTSIQYQLHLLDQEDKIGTATLFKHDESFPTIYQVLTSPNDPAPNFRSIWKHCWKYRSLLSESYEGLNAEQSRQRKCVRECLSKLTPLSSFDRLVRIPLLTLSTPLTPLSS